MGIKQDIEDSLEKFDITKIDGQLTDKDMNQLIREPEQCLLRYLPQMVEVTMDTLA